MLGQTFSNLSGRIATRPEYEKLRKTEFTFSIGLTREVDRLLIDYNLSFGSSLSGNKERKSSSIFSFGAAMTFGLNFSENFSNYRRTRLWPFVGIGIQASNVKLNKDLAAVPFDSVLQSPSWQQRAMPQKFSNTFYCYKTGLAVDFIGKYNKRSSIGLRGGYIGSFKKQ
jgi:hypothetical protein